MSIRRVVPDIASKHLEESRAFYVDVLGFQVAMDMQMTTGRIVTVTSPTNPTAQISLISAGPLASGFREPTLTIEVADVDAAHARAVAAGAQIVYALTTEPWGVRRFFVSDPEGTLINVMSHEK